jgi:hypothetical protein
MPASSPFSPGGAAQAGPPTGPGAAGMPAGSPAVPGISATQAAIPETLHAAAINNPSQPVFQDSSTPDIRTARQDAPTNQ